MWYTVKNGKIARIQSGKTPSDGDNWKKVPDNWQGSVGDMLDWFDEHMRRIPNEELVRQGKRIDKRGVWYNKETQEPKQIYGIDENIDENAYTRDAPIENEPHQKFDRQKNRWVIDAEKKEKAEKEGRLGELKSRVADAEQRQIRPMKAIMQNTATEDDTTVYARYETIIQTLRPEISRLENELKSA